MPPPWSTDTFGNQRPVYQLPPRAVGRCVVLYTERHTATVRIEDAVGEVVNGDSIVYDPIGSGMAERFMIESASGALGTGGQGFGQTAPAAPMETFAPLGQ